LPALLEFFSLQALTNRIFLSEITLCPLIIEEIYVSLSIPPNEGQVVIP
jgi:hypothetical protein